MTTPSILTGQVESVTPMQTSKGKEYSQVRLSVLVGEWNSEEERAETISKPLVLDIWSKTKAEVAASNVGNMVTVGFVLTSREWQGKYYPDVKVTSIKAMEPANTASDALDFN